MKPVFALIVMALPFFCCTANAQKDSAMVYLDSAFNAVPKGGAVYYRTVVHRDKMYFVTMVKLEDGAKVYTGSYKDRALSTEDGLFEEHTESVAVDIGANVGGELAVPRA